jgi:selenocysteine-specific elongation factor
MGNLIIGTAGHIDHGKTALIKALNGYEGDETKEEKQRGITIDLSFSNLKKDDQNIAFIDVPGHEKLVKNMIAGAFGFDYVMLVISSAEGIMPQTIEHIEIVNLLGIKDIVVILTKKDLVDEIALYEQQKKIQEFLKEYDFDIKFIQPVSIYDEVSIEQLKTKLFTLESSKKEEQNFFRYYVDRVFSPKGIGTVVTGTVLGQKIELDEKIILCNNLKQGKVKNIQVHNEDVECANISNRAALNLQGIDKNLIKKGDLISKKGFIRGFKSIDISFKSLKGKELHHNRVYSMFIGSRKLDVKVLLFDSETSLANGFATIKADEEIFSIYGEKLILREGNHTIAGGSVLNSINDPMKKSQKKMLLASLEQKDFKEAYSILLNAHKKGLGLISASQRFALSQEEAIAFAKDMDGVFCDESELVVYPMQTNAIIKQIIKDIYEKNQYAFLSNKSINLRLKWASIAFIQKALDELVYEGLIVLENGIYRSKEFTKDIKQTLEEVILKRLEEEDLAPTAPYNIYDDLDIDRKLGDDILKALCAKKKVIRLQHNLFINGESLSRVVSMMKEIIKTQGYINIKNFKENMNLSRKYLIAYLDYLDNFSQIEKREDKRYFVTS